MFKCGSRINSFFTLFKLTTLQEYQRLGCNIIYLKSTHINSNRLLRTMKLETEEFRQLFTPELKKLIELFEKYQYELRIAGGAVRDLLLGNEPQDIDFASTATPEEMKELFDKENIRMINTKGESHGTITARINDKENFEVTTLRIDVRTDGRHAEVQWTRDWQLDALRRDLTINSMFLGLDGTVYDYFNGREDLAEKKVRFVGSAEDRIQEDYLRILRYFRFYGRVATDPNAHEPATLDAIKENMHGLKGISGERIWMEMKKILTGNHAGSLVPLMIKLGMGPYIGLPQQPNIEEFQGVWAKCHDLKPQPMTLLPALLEESEEVYTLNKTLKVSREELSLALFILAHRGDDQSEDVFKYCQDLHCDTAGKETKTFQKISELLKYRDQRDTLEQFRQWTPPRFPVNGYSLIKLGIKKSPFFTILLTALRQKWKESGYVLNEEELLSMIDEVRKELPRKEKQ